MGVEPVQSEKWQELKVLLMDTLALDPTLRAGFLDRSNISVADRKEIESLLAMDETTDGLLDASALELSKDFLSNGSDDPTIIGQTIGPYELVSELGLGGMGAVYLARRTDGRFDQQVAVKFLKREFNIGKARESFKREVDIQAKLAHPNIATIVDTGTTNDGIPYIVMEYVEGQPIDKFCGEQNLGLIARLKLFNKACEAVGYAHQNLIVHRDIKPSNILVSRDGIPKLLDFGISKPLDAAEGRDITIMSAMTPEYASPEQIDGGRITTSTDIYSLGVLLFKLLTGAYPYDFKKKLNDNNLREITAEDPTPPSRASGSGSSISIARTMLMGDIDNIVLKAISKVPENRYSTVEQFAEDIWRYIDGEPVTARPATFSYRLTKFYRRNRLAVIAGCLVIASILAGSATAMWQANAARGQAKAASEAQQIAETEAANAKAEQAKSEKISKFMAKVISYANPAWYAEGAESKGNARVIDVMDELSDKIDTEFAGQADIQAEVHHKFAEVYGMVGKPWNTREPAKAEEFRKKGAFHALRALELRKLYYGEWHELVAKDLFYSHTLIETEPQKQAEILMYAIQMMRETNPQNLNLPYMLEAYSAFLILPEYAEYSEPYRKAVYPPTDEHNFEIAERYTREALPLFRFHYKEDNPVIFAHECKLAFALAKQEKWADFDEHHAACRRGIELMPTLGSWLEMVNKALAEKGR